MTKRLGYEKSFDTAKQSQHLQGDPIPDVQERPRFDADKPGPYYFKTEFAGGKLSGLTLPGLYIHRSDIRKTTFAGSDLHLSTICWNDFADCDFGDVDLSRSDLRASNFSKCSFKGANLEGCDLRHSTFESCSFDGARLKGALLTRGQQKKLPLSPEQVELIDWQLMGGAFPGGG